LIFLTVGNWHRGFDRLVEAVDRLKGEGAIYEKVVAQIGSGSYRPKNMEIINYCSPSQFREFLAQTRVVVSHAGIGTIFQAIEIGKPVIVVPRKAQLGECGDDHQWRTAEQLEQEGKILVAYEISDLPDRLKQAEHFVPTRSGGNSKIKDIVENFLEELAIKKYGLKKNG
jgi:beta-1,4-N-acetylglucosaminyltransferase